MTKFTVERLSFDSLSELPDSWQNQDYVALLHKMSFDNPEALDPTELKAMCQMALTDLEPTEAAELVLEYLFAEQLNAGQIQNLAHNMLTEKLWEENPELSQHQGFFKATQLLYEAYNGKFPRAEAVRFQVQLTAEAPDDLTMFSTQPEAPLLRLLAQGMPDNTLLKRLFGEQLAGTSFPEAKDIIWQLREVSRKANVLVFEVVSSAYWLDDFKYADTYEATTQTEEVAAEAE
ncbi:hypothetical protein SAMN02745146_2187 [Hymenobacter daecheongensis DSM 21074]|uniref:Uncharacterized protein n=1 Tax=Hymenobacter daecheongensis DSM 21074 TaxID=1121955 RepID=A0A1M6GB21_9BACT|nr:hypothetical protein [Hymenobacter daecheongensis]SHJ07168.1 hypothetical protein SAMN02745146_2187 [Hymenobacter daecheongensis DSM 21074]